MNYKMFRDKSKEDKDFLLRKTISEFCASIAKISVGRIKFAENGKDLIEEGADIFVDSKIRLLLLLDVNIKNERSLIIHLDSFPMDLPNDNYKKYKETLLQLTRNILKAT